MSKTAAICHPEPRVRRPGTRVRQVFCPVGESMTQQQHKDQTDVNAIVERFERTGSLPPNMGQGQFADVSELQGDLSDLINRSRDIQQRFNEFASSWTEKSPEQAVSNVADSQQVQQPVP